MTWKSRVSKVLLAIAVGFSLAGAPKPASAQINLQQNVMQERVFDERYLKEEAKVRALRGNALTLEEFELEPGLGVLSLELSRTPIVGKQLFRQPFTTGQTENLSLSFNAGNIRGGYEEERQRGLEEGLSDNEAWVRQQKQMMDELLGIPSTAYTPLGESRLLSRNYWLKAGNAQLSLRNNGGETFRGLSFGNNFSYQESRDLDQLLLNLSGIGGTWRRGLIGNPLDPQARGTELGLNFGGANYFQSYLQLKQGFRNTQSLEFSDFTISSISGVLSQENNKAIIGNEFEFSLYPETDNVLSFLERDTVDAGLTRSLTGRGWSLEQEILRSRVPGTRYSFSGDDMALSFYSDDYDLREYTLNLNEQNLQLRTSPSQQKLFWDNNGRDATLILDDYYTRLLSNSSINGHPAQAGIGTDFLRVGYSIDEITAFYTREGNQPAIVRLSGDGYSLQRERDSIKLILRNLLGGVGYEESSETGALWMLPRLGLNANFRPDVDIFRYNRGRIIAEAIMGDNNSYLFRMDGWPFQLGWNDQQGSSLQYAPNSDLFISFSDGKIVAVNLKWDTVEWLSLQLTQPTEKTTQMANIKLGLEDLLTVEITGETPNLIGFYPLRIQYTLHLSERGQIDHIYNQNGPNTTIGRYQLNTSDPIRHTDAFVSERDDDWDGGLRWAFEF